MNFILILIFPILFAHFTQAIPVPPPTDEFLERIYSGWKEKLLQWQYEEQLKSHGIADSSSVKFLENVGEFLPASPPADVQYNIPAVDFKSQPNLDPDLIAITTPPPEPEYFIGRHPMLTKTDEDQSFPLESTHEQLKLAKLKLLEQKRQLDKQYLDQQYKEQQQLKQEQHLRDKAEALRALQKELLEDVKYKIKQREMSPSEAVEWAHAQVVANPYPLTLPPKAMPVIVDLAQSPTEFGGQGSLPQPEPTNKYEGLLMSPPPLPHEPMRPLRSWESESEVIDNNYQETEFSQPQPKKICTNREVGPRKIVEIKSMFGQVCKANVLTLEPCRGGKPFTKLDNFSGDCGNVSKLLNFGRFLDNSVKRVSNGLRFGMDAISQAKIFVSMS